MQAADPSARGYEPLAGGMAAALPYVDEFVEGHSLGSLDEQVTHTCDGTSYTDEQHAYDGVLLSLLAGESGPIHFPWLAVLFEAAGEDHPELGGDRDRQRHRPLAKRRAGPGHAPRQRHGAALSTEKPRFRHLAIGAEL